MAEEMRLSVEEDGIAVVYMQNGENRFNISFVDAWNKILDEIDRNKSIRGLIITGTDKYFSLGLDLAFFQTLTPERVMQARVQNGRLIKRLTHLPIPTVAALNARDIYFGTISISGHAYGAGAFLALSCDYRVMRSDRGYICFPEVSLGMRIQYTNLALLRQKILKGRSLRDAILFGKAMTAEEARSRQVVDVISVKDSVIIDAKALIVEALGKRGIARKALGDMKKDVYDLPDVPTSATAALPKL